jgi:carbon storage regulator CsrA
MLVLTRKTNQQIQIGENVVITILHVKGQSVRVGIEAPRQVRVVRSEIAELPIETGEAAPSMPQPADLDSSEVATRLGTTVGGIKSPTKARNAYVHGARRTQAGCFSSPLADRVTAVIESSGGEESAVSPSAARSYGGDQHSEPHGYHFQVGRCSALTTHPSGQRP